MYVLSSANFVLLFICQQWLFNHLAVTMRRNNVVVLEDVLKILNYKANPTVLHIKRNIKRDFLLQERCVQLFSNTELVFAIMEEPVRFADPKEHQQIDSTHSSVTYQSIARVHDRTWLIFASSFWKCSLKTIVLSILKVLY